MRPLENTPRRDPFDHPIQFLGKPVLVAQAPREAVVPTFTSFGISANIAGLFREMYDGIEKGTEEKLLRPVFEQLIEYTKVHFAQEEEGYFTLADLPEPPRSAR